MNLRLGFMLILLASPAIAQPKEFVAVGIIHKKTTGICSDASLVRWGTLSIDPDQHSKVLQQLDDALKAQCAPGAKGGCDLPTRVLIPADQVAVVVRFRKRWDSFNCTSNELAVFKGKSSSEVEAQLRDASLKGGWEGVIVVERWPLPPVSAP